MVVEHTNTHLPYYMTKPLMTRSVGQLVSVKPNLSLDHLNVVDALLRRLNLREAEKIRFVDYFIASSEILNHV